MPTQLRLPSQPARAEPINSVLAVVREGDEVDREPVTFENLQDADLRGPPRAPPRQHNAYAGTLQRTVSQSGPVPAACGSVERFQEERVTGFGAKGWREEKEEETRGTTCSAECRKKPHRATELHHSTQSSGFTLEMQTTPGSMENQSAAARRAVAAGAPRCFSSGFCRPMPLGIS